MSSLRVDRVLEEVKELLMMGFSMRKICMELLPGKISEPTIKKYLTSFIKDCKEMHKKELGDLVVEKYAEYQQIHLVAKELKIADMSVKKFLKERNIAQKYILTNNQHARKHKINENYFEKIDSLEKAYYLGLFYADGVVHMRERPYKNIVKISLKETDSYILNSLNNSINYGREMPRYEYKDGRGKPCKIFTANSKKMCLDLIKLGCVQRKSKILELPFENNIIEEKYHSAFLRGLFDGDGSSAHMSVSITSSNLFCDKLKEYLYNNLSIDCRIKYYGNYAMIFPRGIVSQMKFYKFIYRDENFPLHLKRKKDNFDNYLDNNRKCPSTIKSFQENNINKIKICSVSIQAHST